MADISLTRLSDIDEDAIIDLMNDPAVGRHMPLLAAGSRRRTAGPSVPRSRPCGSSRVRPPRHPDRRPVRGLGRLQPQDGKRTSRWCCTRITGARACASSGCFVTRPSDPWVSTASPPCCPRTGRTGERSCAWASSRKGWSRSTAQPSSASGCMAAAREGADPAVLAASVQLARGAEGDVASVFNAVEELVHLRMFHRVAGFIPEQVLFET